MFLHSTAQVEIFYSYQPLYLRGGIQTLSESELYELDHLAEPDKNMEQIEHLRTTNEKFSVLYCTPVKFTVWPDCRPPARHFPGCITVNSGGLQYNK